MEILEDYELVILNADCLLIINVQVLRTGASVRVT